MEDRGPSTQEQVDSVQRVMRDSSLAALFRRHTHLYSTRSSEGFAARCLKSGEEVVLWLLRFPLPEGSAEDRRFLSRMESIAAHLPPNVLQRFGIDDRGVAFAALRMERCDSIMKLSMPLSQRTIAWMGVVRVVSELHAHGIVLGDISDDSFVWHPERGPQLVGIMGTFDAAGSATAMLPPQHTMRYLAPEQRGVFAAEAQFDVFALGVFGYRLLSGAYPYALQDGVPDGRYRTPVELEVLDVRVAEWTHQVIGIALQPESKFRFESATEMLAALESKTESVDGRTRLSVWARQTTQLSPSERSRVVGQERQREPESKPSEVNSTVPDSTTAIRSPQPKFPLPLVWFAAGCIGVFLSVLLFWLLNWFAASRIEPYSEAHRSYVPPELEEHLAVISDRSISIERRESAVELFARTENQFVFPILASLVQGAYDPAIRRAALDSLAQSIRRSGMTQVATVFAEELPLETLREKFTETSNPLLHLVRSADTLQPMDARLAALERVYPEIPETAIRLAGALAIDLRGREQVRLLQRLVLLDKQTLCFQSGFCEPRQRVETLVPALDLSGLLLVHPALVSLFDLIAVEQMWVESPETQAYILEYLYFHERGQFERALNLGLEQGALGPLANEVVDYLRDAGNALEQPLSVSLLRALVGVLDEQDLFRFNRWKDLEAGRLLVAVAGILVERDNPRAIDVFDIASRKVRASSAEQALLEFVRTEAWTERSRLIHPVAVLVHSEVFPIDAVASAFDAFERYSARHFFNTLVKGGNSRTIQLGLLRLGSQLPSSQIVSLLKDDDPSVRMEAARALSGRNDLSVLQSILAAYDAEQNPEVRRVYEQLHWVTKGR